jgi:hypothetical protein
VLDFCTTALARLRSVIAFVFTPQEPNDDERDAWW